MFSFSAEMLSRLSGLANVVLHELSGDDTDENMRASLDPVSSSILNETDDTFVCVCVFHALPGKEFKIESFEQPLFC